MTSVPDPSPAAPEQFGPYELLERLGIGGMATVYRAKKRGPEGFERSFALKRMLQHLAEDTSFVDSFIREAKVASMLSHPNIAQVYDFGRIAGTYYIAMELVAGYDLRRLLRYANRANEPIAMPVVFSILAELCDALEYAHTFVDETGTPQRIVHRDISPSNLIIAPTGHLKVIDFGIAKASMGHLRTETGMVKGKLGYMAPEVALGMSVGPGADVFSMGVVAWELITASPLFTARTDFETMRKLREGEIQPPSELNPTCPPELDQIVLQALARDEDRRIPSAGMFRRLLDGIAARYGIAMSARAVAEWLVQMPQSLEGTRNSFMPGSAPIPQTQATAMLRPSGTKLKRSHEEISLASDIWGEDARTSAPGSEPDFNAASIAGSQAFPPQGSQYGGRPSHPSQRGLPLPPPPQTTMGPPTYTAQHALQPSQQYPAPSSFSSQQYSLQYGSAQFSPTPSQANIRPGRKWLWALVAVLVIGIGVTAGYVVSKPGSGAAAAVGDPNADGSGSAAVPTRGKVKLAIAPDGTTIEIGGKEIGKSPLDIDLDPGVYSVTAHKDGFKGWTGTVTIAAGGAQNVSVALVANDVVAKVDPQPQTPVPAPPAVVGNPLTPHHQQQQQHHGQHGNAHVAAPDVTKHDPDPETKVDPPKVDPTPPPKVDPTPPPKVDPTPPPKVDPPKVDPVPTGPVRTPVVGATAVTKVSGDLPVIRADSESGDVLAKLCIDDGGRVTSVKVVTAPPGVADKLVHAFDTWHYKPYLNQQNKASPVCFPVSMHVVVKRPD